MAFENKSLNFEDNKSKLLGAFIRLKREEENMSISFLADIVKISKAYLSEIEHGKKTPAEYTLTQILKVLDTNYFSDEDKIEYLHDSLIKVYENIAVFQNDIVKKITDEILSDKDYYLCSEGFLLYSLFEFIYYVQYGINYEKCLVLIKIIQDHLMLMRKDEIVIFHDIVAAFYIQKGLFNEAEIHLNYAIEQVSSTTSSSMYGMILYHYAKLYQANGNLIKALSFCEKARTEFYNKLNYKRILFLEIFEANVYSMFYFFDEAEKKYLKILEKAQGNKFTSVALTVLDNLCWLKLRIGKYEECIEYCIYTIEQGTTYDEILLYIPICYLKMNEKTKCLDEINKVIDKIKFPLKYLLGGIYYLCLNQGQKAIECLETYIYEDISMDKEMKCFVYEMMAEHYIHTGNLKEAIHIQQQIIKTLKHN